MVNSPPGRLCGGGDGVVLFPIPPGLKLSLQLMSVDPRRLRRGNLTGCSGLGSVIMCGQVSPARFWPLSVVLRRHLRLFALSFVGPWSRGVCPVGGFLLLPFLTFGVCFGVPRTVARGLWG